VILCSWLHRKCTQSTWMQRQVLWCCAYRNFWSINIEAVVSTKATGTPRMLNIRPDTTTWRRLSVTVPHAHGRTTKCQLLGLYSTAIYFVGIHKFLLSVSSPTAASRLHYSNTANHDIPGHETSYQDLCMVRSDPAHTFAMFLLYNWNSAANSSNSCESTMTLHRPRIII